MSNTERQLELGYYHPSARFLSVTEHISVMDTNIRVPGGDGALIAIFGESRCGGATAEQVAETEADARLFIAAHEMLTLCKRARTHLQALCEALGDISNESDVDLINALDVVIAKAE